MFGVNPFSGVNGIGIEINVELDVSNKMLDYSTYMLRQIQDGYNGYNDTIKYFA